MQKLKSSSLLFTIYVSLIIYIVAASLVILFFFYSTSINQYIHSWELKNACLSVLEENLTEQPYSINQSKDIIPTDEIDALINIKKDFWGFFKTFEITAKQGKNNISSYFLIGSTNKNLNALYLADNNSYVKASGKTVISGNIHVPGAHIQRSYFSGNINPVDSLRRSPKNLPKLNSTVINNLPIKRNQINVGKFKEVSFSDLRSQNISVKMKDTALYIYSDKTIDLSDNIISGKVILHSQSKIIVYASAQLNDVIVTAPEIVIKQGFKGNAQFIADSILSVEPYCELKYPTVLAGVGNSEITIDIGNNSSIAGAIILAGDDRSKFSSIRLNKTTTVYGLIYSNDICYLGGTVYGSVYSQEIGSADNLSDINSLNNVTINKYRLKEEFILPIIFGDQDLDVIDSSFY